MSSPIAVSTLHAPPYAPPAAADLLAEGLACVVAGRPLPEALRPAPAPMPAVATVAAGIGRILAGPPAHLHVG